MKTYVVHAARHDDWWALSIDVPRRSIWTQCRRPDLAVRLRCGVGPLRAVFFPSMRLPPVRARWAMN